MFRKFLKKLPKADGKSEMDWEVHFVQKTEHLWTEKEREFLEDLISPVPKPFRDVARHKIASKIGELALERNAPKINRELVIQGYIIASPKRDHKFLRKKLAEKNIPLQPYEKFFTAN